MELNARRQRGRVARRAGFVGIVLAALAAACVPTPTAPGSTTTTSTIAGATTTSTSSIPGATTTTTSAANLAWKLAKRTAEVSLAPGTTLARTSIEVAGGDQATLLTSTNGGQHRLELATLVAGVPTGATTVDVGATGDRVEDLGMGDGLVAVLLAGSGTGRKVEVRRRTAPGVWVLAGTVAFASTNVGGGTSDVVGSVVIGGGRLVVAEVTRGAALAGTVRSWDIDPAGGVLVKAGPTLLTAPPGTNDLGLLTWGSAIDLDGSVLAVAEGGGGAGGGAFSHVAVYQRATSGFGAPEVVAAGRADTDLPKVAVDVTAGVTRVAMTETGALVTSLIRLMRRDAGGWVSEAAFAVTSSSGATPFNFGVALDLDAGVLAYNDGLALRYPNPGTSTSVRIRRLGATGWPVEKSLDPFVVVNGLANDTVAVTQLSLVGDDIAEVVLRLPAGATETTPGSVRTDTYHRG